MYVWSSIFALFAGIRYLSCVKSAIGRTKIDFIVLKILSSGIHGQLSDRGCLRVSQKVMQSYEVGYVMKEIFLGS